MHARLRPLLVCLACRGALDLRTFDGDGTDTREGCLVCPRCAAWFPIIAGIPRIFVGDLRIALVLRPHRAFFAAHRSELPPGAAAEWAAAFQAPEAPVSLPARTAESFGYEWTTFHRMCDQYRKNFLDYIDPIGEEFFRGKVVLDAGSGVGRHTYWAAKFGAADVVAVDLSEAVLATAQNTRDLPNVHVVQADLTNLPFGPIFDYVFCIGVLHHLPDPPAGFRALAPLVRSGGTYSIWVYGRRHNRFHVYFAETVRRATRRLPHRLLHALCYLPAVGVAVLNVVTKVLRRFRATTRLAERVPFSVYADFPFAVKLNDAFDVFATPRSTYWTIEEVQRWYQDAGCTDVHASLLRRKSVKAYGVRGRAA